MKLKRKLPPKLPIGAAYFYPEGSRLAFLVDRELLPKLRKIRWRFLPKRQRVRGFFGRQRTRQYLHRYILALRKKYYPEVTFANGDFHDCRLINLKAYRRFEEGANRRLFKNSSTRRKGVSFHTRTRKWISMIRVRGHLRHLGYFQNIDDAADAYARAWNLAHPGLPSLPVKSRV